MADKRALGDEDHDWVVRVHYAISNADADRAGVAEESGVTADPPIAMLPHAMALTKLICQRCEQPWSSELREVPCPGVPFERYVLSLDPDTREKVIADFHERLTEDPPVVFDGANGPVITAQQKLVVPVPDISGLDL